MSVDLQEFEAYAAEHTGVGPLGLLPGLVAGAMTKSGRSYLKAFGTTSVNSDTPLKEDAVMWIASCTKLLGAVSAMKAVELGLFTLDEPVSRLLPEFAEPDILSVDDQGKLVTRKATKPITARLLLTHRSGMSYDALHPLLLKWRASRGEKSGWMAGDLKASYETPLIAEPGDMWFYSPGIDWAGQMVERASGKKLGEFMKEHIFIPLGVKDIAFRPTAEMKARKMPMASRKDVTSQLAEGATRDYPEWTEDAKDDCAGAGMFGTVPDYLKVLQTLLLNDGKVLKKDSVDELFRPQMTDPSTYHGIIDIPDFHDHFVQGLPRGPYKFNYALGGSFSESGVDGIVEPGTMHWGGIPNCLWWIDRRAGVCGMLATQLVPSGEPRCQILKNSFVRNVRFYMGETADRPSL